MRFAYRRVSTTEQNTARQLAGLKFDRIFEDKLSGKDTNRPQLQTLLAVLREDDEIHIHELSRLGRSLPDLHKLIDQIVSAGASIIFHKENLKFEPNKNDPFQQLMLSLLGAISQFERDITLDRIREGIAIAKAAGKYKGRRSRFTKAQVAQFRSEFASVKNKSALAKEWGISRGYAYKLAQEPQHG